MIKRTFGYIFYIALAVLSVYLAFTQPILFSLVSGMLTIIGGLHLMWRHFEETRRFWMDALRKLRIYILVLLFIFVGSTVPVVMYSVCRLLNIDAEGLRNIATVTGRLSGIAGIIVLELIFRYKK